MIAKFEKRVGESSKLSGQKPSKTEAILYPQPGVVHSASSQRHKSRRSDADANYSGMIRDVDEVHCAVLS